MLALQLVLWSPANADNPLNSSEKADPNSGVPLSKAGRTDFTIVPVAGGSTDIGVGVGAFAGVTRNKEGDDPYLWHVEAAGFISFNEKNGALDLPYVDVYSKLTVDHFLGRSLELEVRPSFTDELVLYYYGLGNASSAANPPGKSNEYFQYARLHPEVLSDLLYKIRDHVAGRVGLRYIENSFDIPPESQLANDIKNGTPEVRKLIGPTGTEGEALLRTGLQFDNRDNEVSPHLGTFDEIGLNWSPGGIRALPFNYGEASVVLRGYVPLLTPRLTLAARVVGDVLFGDVPLYELSRAIDQYAIGGSNGVRGVPAQRYYGKVKVFGNFELRAKLFDFRIFGKLLGLGTAVFFDAGRLWADTTRQTALDGTGLGLKYGVGGGLRLVSGTAFVLRADVAWSPDATPIGAYLIAGEAF